MINGVTITPLKQILDERGKVMHMLRNDSDVFVSFGEIYFSCVYPGAVKAWGIHKRMILNYAVPFGRIKLVLYDNRENSLTKGELQEIVLGQDNYSLVTIPALIWVGFQGLGNEMAIVANCASIPHDPEETEKRDIFDHLIPYKWEIKRK